MTTATPTTDEICEDYNPLEGVVLHDRPCPPGKNPEQAIREAREIAGLEVPPLDDVDETLVRMLSNAIEYADSRVPEAGSYGGDIGYWTGKAEAQELAQRGWPITYIAKEADVEPERIARLFTKERERAQQVLDADALVRSDDWDGTIDSVIAASGLPRSTVQQLLIRLGVTTKAQTNKRQGGGTKYTAEQYEAIRVYRCEYGWGWKQIEKHTGIKDSTCIKIAQRKGWV